MHKHIHVHMYEDRHVHIAVRYRYSVNMNKSDLRKNKIRIEEKIYDLAFRFELLSFIFIKEIHVIIFIHLLSRQKIITTACRVAYVCP